MGSRITMIIWIHVLIAITDCQFLSTYNTSCSWNSCCEIKCTDYCNHPFSCQTHHKTITAGNVSWCTAQVNDLILTPSLINIINITFTSSGGACTICTDEEGMCCGPDETVVPINCSTVSYSTHTICVRCVQWYCMHWSLAHYLLLPQQSVVYH